MDKKLLCVVLAAFPAMAYAQSSIDAYNVSQGDLRGTARFTSMAGAFTALGGDISTLHQNPAGIGVYRKSEVGISAGLDFLSAKSEADGFSNTQNHTRFSLNNVGYV